MSRHTILTTIPRDGAVEAACTCRQWHGGTFTSLLVAEHAHEAHAALCKPVAQPRVPTRYLEPSDVVDGRKVVAECRHCQWTLRAHSKAEVELEVAAHRDAHRVGALEVTR